MKYLCTATKAHGRITQQKLNKTTKQEVKALKRSHGHGQGTLTFPKVVHKKKKENGNVVGPRSLNLTCRSREEWIWCDDYREKAHACFNGISFLYESHLQWN